MEKRYTNYKNITSLSKYIKDGKCELDVDENRDPLEDVCFSMEYRTDYEIDYGSLINIVAREVERQKLEAAIEGATHE